jgi:hypothetical protein
MTVRSIRDDDFELEHADLHSVHLKRDELYPDHWISRTGKLKAPFMPKLIWLRDLPDFGGSAIRYSLGPAIITISVYLLLLPYVRF